MAKPHHLPDDLLATPALQERFFLESQFEGAGYKSGYWFLRQRDNGEFSRKAVKYVPEYPVVRLTEMILGNLNKRVSQGGAWVSAWVNEGEKLINLWLDKDGDVQFTVETDAADLFHPVEYRRLDLDDIVANCFEAWRLWHHHMVDVLEVREGRDTYRRAQGEQPPSAR